jgi:hypothetical protein
MTALLIGYARVSTDAQDLTAQRDGLLALGVEPGRIYVDHGMTGTNRERPGLWEALAACREGDTLVVTKLDRLIEAHDEWQVADRRYLSEASIALLNPPQPTALEPRRPAPNEEVDRAAPQTA